MHPQLLGSLSFAAVLLAPALAQAHIHLTEPPARSDVDNLTQGPCGGVAPTDTPAEYEGGSVLTISWEQGASHDGSYRVALSPGNDEGFDDNVLLADVPDDGETTSLEITLPDGPCVGCTLQLIQFSGGEDDDYYSCADITITGVAGSTGTGTGSDTGAEDSTGGGDDTAGDSTGVGDSTGAGDTTGASGTTSNPGSTSAASTTASTTGSGDTEGGTDTAGATNEGDSGCSCSAGRDFELGAAVVLMGLLGFARRRRIA
jgi:MYXO-CTERM domain-containing protein